MIVTAIDRAYLPGLKALHNSYKANSPGLKFACIVYGDDDLAQEVADRGIQVLHNPVMDVKLPTTDRYPVGNPAMYCRLMLPHWFDCDTVWMDADQVILKPLNPLFSLKYSKPCAAVQSVPISQQVEGLRWDDAGLYAGLIHFNREVWLRERVTERCFDFMNTSKLVFKYVVQSVLGVVLRGNFHRLGKEWQHFGNRAQQPIQPNARVVHWHGWNRNPWTYPMANLELWKKYAECE